MTLPGADGANLPCGTSSGIQNTGMQDPGVHSTSEDAGPPNHPQHPVPPRPVFYVHAPPPLPFLHYQWPMPFSYNPFAGYPGMGYGMVMPPFPPPPYMEPPAYILPQPHVQAVDYRRLLHPQAYASSVPFQNPGQPRRVRTPHTAPVRQTVNSEVQTEPTHRVVGGYSGASLLASSDSGHGTASSSPLSSSQSSPKKGSTDIESHRVNRTGKSSAVEHCITMPDSPSTKSVRSPFGATTEMQKNCKDTDSQEGVPPCRNGHCNMWSVSSQDSIIPVCSSSQQENELVKERRVSIPDILMSGTPQSTKLKVASKVLTQEKCQLLASQTDLELENRPYPSHIEKEQDSVLADGTDANDEAAGVLSSKESESNFKILKLPSSLYALLSDARRVDEFVDELDGSSKQELLHSPNTSYTCQDEQDLCSETNIHEVIPHQMPLNGYQMKRKMNESVWSVESLAPFVPNKEWLLQNDMIEPEVILEKAEEAEHCRPSTQHESIIVKMRQLWRFSSSDAIPMSDNGLIFSTPAGQSPPERQETESELYASEVMGPKQNHSVTVSSASQTCLRSKMAASLPTAEGVDENGSSEPEASHSPNQEYLNLKSNQGKCPCSPYEDVTLYLNSPGEEKSPPSNLLILLHGGDNEVEEDVSQLRNEQSCGLLGPQSMFFVSPSKGHLVDCGVQCAELQCFCENSRGNMEPSWNREHPFKYSDVKKAYKEKAEGFGMNGHIQKKRFNQRRNRGSERYSNQQDAFGGSYAKPGKAQGGNGRNPRY